MKTLLAKIMVCFMKEPTDIEVLKAIAFKKHSPYSHKIPFWNLNNQDLLEAYAKHRKNVYVLAFPWGGY